MKLNLNLFKSTINQQSLHRPMTKSQAETQVKATSSLTIKDSISLNQTNSKVENYRSMIRQELVQDEEKVQRIKTLIKDGNYQIHVDSIAKAMMDASHRID